MRIAYGVDVENGAVRIVRAERSGRGIACTEVSASDARWVRDTARGVSVAGCLTQRESFVRWIRAPYGARKKAVRVLPTLLDMELPFDLEDCSYTFLDLHAADSATKALAVGARLNTLREKLDLLSGAGVDPQVLDVESVALWAHSFRDVPANADTAGALRILLHATPERCCLVAGRGRRLVCAHAVRPGDTAQVERFLSAAFGAEGASAHWIGSGSACANDAALAPWRDALHDRWPGPWTIVETPDLFLANALAVRALSEGALACNLRGELMAHPVLRARMNRARRWTAGAALAAGFLLILLNLGIRWSVAQRRTALRNAFRESAGRVAGYDTGDAKGEHALRLASGAALNRESELEPFLAVFAKPRTWGLFEVLGMASEAQLKVEALAIGEKDATLRGSAPVWTSPETLRDRLVDLGFAVTLDRKDATPDGRIPFEIRTEKRRE